MPVYALMDAVSLRLRKHQTWNSGYILNEERKAAFSMAKTDSESFYNSPLFSGLSRPDIEVILRQARPKKIKKGHTLFHQGDSAEFTFMVKSGQIKLFQSSRSGNQTLLRVIGPGEILAITTTLGVLSYPATAVAERPTELMALSGKQLEDLVLKIPRLGINALRILSLRVREMQDRFSELAAEKLERRLARTIMRLAAQVGRKHERGVLLDLEISRQDLGEMAGTTVYSISRILSGWERAGILELGRKKILVRTPHALYQIAEELE
jgi:CRP-like cAMP-binding protein